MKPDTLLLLLPIIFMVHDFEEIIMAKPWFQRNRQYLMQRHLLPAPFLRLYERIEPVGFTFVVAQEFLLITLLTGLCIAMQWYDVWVAMLISFQLHLIVHIIQAVVFRCYTPALITSVLCSGYSVYMFLGHLPPFDLLNSLILTISMLIMLVLNLWASFKLALRFQNWLYRYSRPS